MAPSDKPEEFLKPGDDPDVDRLLGELRADGVGGDPFYVDIKQKRAPHQKPPRAEATKFPWPKVWTMLVAASIVALLVVVILRAARTSPDAALPTMSAAPMVSTAEIAPSAPVATPIVTAPPPPTTTTTAATAVTVHPKGKPSPKPMTADAGARRPEPSDDIW